MLGREVRLPVELMYNYPSGQEISSYGEYISNLKEKMEHAHEVARKHLGQGAVRQKETYDAKSTLNAY